MAQPKPESHNTTVMEPTNDPVKKEKHVTLIQEPSSVTSIKDVVSKSTENLLSAQSNARNDDPTIHLGKFGQTIESLNELRGVTQEKNLHQLEIENKKDLLKWEKLSLKFCCGRSTTYAISILAPIEMTVMILCTLVSVSLLNVKFMSVDELKSHNVPRTLEARHIRYVSDELHDTFIGRTQKGGLLLHVNMSQRATNILNGCGVNYVYDIHPTKKRKELSKWTAIVLIGFVLRIIATVPLFFVRKNEVQESLEGRRLCFIYLVMQPFGFAFVFFGALLILQDTTLCELDYVFGSCCLRTAFFYFGVFWAFVFKVPELAILFTHWKALENHMERNREFRKTVALLRKQRAEESKCILFPSVSYVNKSKHSRGPNAESSNDCGSTISAGGHKIPHKHKSSSKSKTPIPIDITRMSSFVASEAEEEM